MIQNGPHFCKTHKFDVTPDPDVDTVYNPHTLAGKLMDIWTTHPEREAIVFYDDNNVRSSVTNRKMRILCERFASIVRDSGVKKGQVVCNLLSPGIEKEVANFGLIIAGAVLMNGWGLDDTVDVFWKPLEQANVKAIILDPHPEAVGWKLLQHDVGRHRFVESYDGNKRTSLETVFLFRVKSRDYGNTPFTPRVKPALDILEEAEARWTEAVYSHDPCHIYIERCHHQRHYKLVMRTHRGMCIVAERSGEMLNVQHNDIIYNDWPLSWVSTMPISYITKGCTMVKSTLIYCEAKLIVREVWDMIVKEKCTMAGLPPPLIHMLESHCNDLPEPHWRLKAITTNYQFKNTIIDAIGVITRSIIFCYSRIESGMVSRYKVNEDNKTNFDGGCTGEVHTAIRTQFNGPTKHTVGEMILSGGLVAGGYYNDEELTKCFFTKDGAFITGDLGYYDDQGRLFIVGRKSEAILRRGIAILPSNIEEMINMCPGIWKVKVVVVKDPHGILQMAACVVPRIQDAITIDRVKEYCRFQLGSVDENEEDPHMPAHVLFFKSFPLHRGKVHMHLLAHMVSEILKEGQHKQSSVGSTSKESSK